MSQNKKKIFTPVYVLSEAHESNQTKHSSIEEPEIDVVKNTLVSISENLEENRLRVQNAKISFLNVKVKLQNRRTDLLTVLKDLKNAEEMQRITLRIEDIDHLAAEIRQSLMNCVPGSADENKFIDEHMKLTQEKDSLVRKQDYFNVLGTLNETTEKITAVQHKLARFSNDGCKTEEEKQLVDSLMKELKDLVDKKNELAHQMLNKEAEEEEIGEQSRLSLERTQYVLNSQQTPMSAPKRIMNRILDTPLLTRFNRKLDIRKSGA
uniref:BMERB domain-containing protein n=1 Tax=Acrobeloides nanus TaxID=290746 RepID=A0A914EG09_9BILA